MQERDGGLYFVCNVNLNFIYSRNRNPRLATTRPFSVGEREARLEGKGRLVKLARFSFSFRAKIGGYGQPGVAVITNF